MNIELLCRNMSKYNMRYELKVHLLVDILSEYSRYE